MSSYDKYNQAISEEKQLNQVEQEVRPQVEEQLSQVETAEKDYNKKLRYAVISNQDVDLRQATEDKQTISQAKQDVQAPLREIEKERSRIQSQKSAVKSPDQLESQGYKKEVKGSQVVYYKEDTYNRKKGDKRTYREEEYIFTKEGRPVKIIKRDDYRDGDRRRVDEEEVVSFDSQGRVSQVRTYDDGEKDERVSYDFQNDGSFSVETRDYAKERRLKEKAQKEYDAKLAEQRKYKNITASVDIYGNSEYSETAWNPKTKQWEKTTTTYTKQSPNIPKSTKTKTLQATKTKIEPSVVDQLKVDTLPGLGGVPGVNQGTDTSNIPKQTISTRPQNTISAPAPPTSQELQEMAARAQWQKEYDAANPVKKFFMKDWAAESKNQRDKFDQSGGTDLDALTYEIGAGFIAGAQGAGQVVRGLATEPITTTKNIVTGIPQIPGYIKEKAQTNPGGLAGELLFDLAAGNVLAEGAAVARNTLRPASVTRSAVDPVSANVLDDVVTTRTAGSFDVESGLVFRKSQGFTYESIGRLERVKSVDVPDEVGSSVKQIAEQRQGRLSDRPATVETSVKQITQRSDSTDLTNPTIKAEKGSSKTASEKTVAAQESKEVFRGEITTQIKNNKGEVIKTQKLPAELVRDGKTQTLYVDGKPFDLVQNKIDTPKQIAVEGDLYMEEGAFGLSQKKSTTQTIMTDLETGSKQQILTQQIDDAVDPLFSSSGKSSASQRRLSEQRKDLLSDKPQTPPEAPEMKNGALTDPIISASKKKRSSRSSKTVSEKSDGQSFEGVSMAFIEDPLSVSKRSTPNIIEGEITGERAAPKQVGFEQPKLTQDRSPSL